MKNRLLQNLENAQEKVARIITATGVGVEFTPRVSLPMADVHNNRIKLPPLPEELTDAELTKLRSSIDHETAHLLYTKDKDGNPLPKPKGAAGLIANGLEDGRINKLMGERFFGSSQNLETGCEIAFRAQRDNFEREFAGVPVDDPQRIAAEQFMAVLKMSGITHGLSQDVIDLLPPDRFTPTMPEAIRAEIEAIETTEDVMNAVPKIKDWLFTEPDVPEPEMPGASGNDSSTEQSSDSSEGKDKQKGKKTSQRGADSPEKGKSKADDTDSEDEDKPEAEDEDNSGASEAVDSPESDEDDSEGEGKGEDENDDSEPGEDGETGDSDDTDGEDETDSGADGDSEDSDGDSEDSDDTEGDDFNAESDSDDDSETGEAEETTSEPVRFSEDDFTDYAERAERAIAAEFEIDPTRNLEDKDSDGEPAYRYYVDDSADVEIHVKNVLEAAGLERFYTDVYRKEGEALFAGLNDKVAAMRGRLILDLQSQGRVWTRDLESGRRLDTRNLHRAGVADGRIFKNKIKRDTVNTAVTLVVDSSGSMGFTEYDTSRYATALQLAALFCDALEMAGVPCEVLGFTTHSTKTPAFGIRHEGLLNLIYKGFHETSAATRQHWYKGRIVLNQNVDGESIIWAAKRLAKRTEQRKLMIVLSDGRPQARMDRINSRYFSRGRILDDHLKDSVELISKSGIEVLGVGIQTDAVRRYYPNHVVYNGLDTLMTGFYQGISSLLRTGNVRMAG